MSTTTEQTYKFKGKKYRPTGECRLPKKGEIILTPIGNTHQAEFDYVHNQYPILEEVPTNVPQVVVSFLTKRNIENSGQALTVEIPHPSSAAAQTRAAEAVREHWDKVSEIIEDVVLIHLAFGSNIEGSAWSWSIPRESSCWKYSIQPVIDELTKPKRPALLDDPRYVAALEHVNNVLAKFDKPPVERLEPSRAHKGLRSCNCPISVTINKALGFAPTNDAGYYDPYTGVTANTGTHHTSIVGPSNGSVAELQSIKFDDSNVTGFVTWADLRRIDKDKALAEARDA
ncbi:hypothetical protein [Sinimarinibacterium flocculans]|uniref:hypothetical protein n=1 Tax=Sinimarinibacterium flocculans TaxID=985250 RepID=UPI0024922F6A|nr:hypothetical protein [Sinimarinibacterium flocculans]